MKNTLLSFSCLFMALTANSQTPKFQWVKQTGASYFDEGRNLTTDDSGNVFSIGAFQGSIDFNPGSGTFNMSSAGANDIFISKMDAKGNFVWAKRMGGYYQDFGNEVKVDKAGNIYSTGAFADTADLDPGSGRLKLTSAGYADAFMSKWDNTGKLLWAKRIGGISNDFGRSIAVDGLGNVYTAGDYSGTVDLNPGSGTNNVLGQGMFITKLNANGNYIWARNFQSTYTHSIKVDAAGNLYVAGTFTGTIDFDPGAGVMNLTSKGNRDVFVMKLDSSGNLAWAKKFAGNTYEDCLSITLNGGKVYTTGSFQDTIDLDPGTGVHNLIANGGDVFISQLDSAGNFGWAGHISSDSGAQGTGVTTDALGNVYIIGTFYDSADFNPGTGRPDFIAESKALSIFILKLDKSGNFVWAQNYGGGTTNYGPPTIAVDPSGNVYSTGLFVGTADFCPGPGTFNLTSAPPNNSPDIYLLKIAQCLPIDITTTLTGTTIKANQTGATYQWIDCNNGNLPVAGQTARIFTPLVSGKYAVIITLGSCSSTSACTIVTGTGIPNYHPTDYFMVYPNPTNGVFNFTLSNSSENTSIEIYNTVGSLIYKTNAVDIKTIDLSNYANGLYIIKVLDDSTLIAIQKIVKL